MTLKRNSPLNDESDALYAHYLASLTPAEKKIDLEAIEKYKRKLALYNSLSIDISTQVNVGLGASNVRILQYTQQSKYIMKLIGYSMGHNYNEVVGQASNYRGNPIQFLFKINSSALNNAGLNLLTDDFNVPINNYTDLIQTEYYLGTNQTIEISIGSNSGVAAFKAWARLRLVPEMNLFMMME